MISSMTGFVHQSERYEWGCLIWELRSVNHRYLELGIKLPEPFRLLENDMRQQVQQKLKRGKVDAILKYHPGEAAGVSLHVNHSLVKQLTQAVQQTKNQLDDARVNVMDVLSWPGVVAMEEMAMDTIRAAAIDLLENALNEMCTHRQREGVGLKSFLEKNIERMRKQVDAVKKHMPEILQNHRDKTIARFQELSLSVDADRLEQEMVWWMQKLDVEEELQRLESHLDEVERVIEKGGVVGRRLDFLMQELNREANTLASKSIHAESTQLAVELKVLIEQMREQVQNIE